MPIETKLGWCYSLTCLCDNAPVAAATACLVKFFHCCRPCPACPWAREVAVSCTRLSWGRSCQVCHMLSTPASPLPPALPSLHRFAWPSIQPRLLDCGRSCSCLLVVVACVCSAPVRPRALGCRDRCPLMPVLRDAKKKNSLCFVLLLMACCHACDTA